MSGTQCVDGTETTAAELGLFGGRQRQRSLPRTTRASGKPHRLDAAAHLADAHPGEISYAQAAQELEYPDLT